MKNVAIYLGEALNDGIGIGEFENHLAMELAKMACDLETKHAIKLFFIVPQALVGKYGDKVGYIKMKTKKVFFKRKHVLEEPPRIDLLHLTHQRVKLKQSAPSVLMTVHDANFFHNDISRFRIWKKARRMRIQLKRATHLSFISHFSEQDIKSHFNISVPSRVIYNGVTDLSACKGMMPGIELPKRYFLHISRLAPKKNVHLLVKMMKHMPGENLVLAGKGRTKYENKLKRLIAAEGLGNVYMTGHVSMEEKAALLDGCEALLFPSKSEGFGLPVAEAMCFGKPVFITRLTSLPEVGGEEAYYFDKLEPGQMAATVDSGMANFKKDMDGKSRRIKEHAATFNWKKTAAEFISYYIEILK